ncbi:MAG TPA: flavin reductase family protein [Thermomicrobiales bacterium]|nr:flavin reductase family protein [Thermomicrobiales bacterium]
MTDDRESGAPREVSGGGIRTGASRRATRPLSAEAKGKTPSPDLARVARRRWPSGVTVVTTVVDASHGGGFRGLTVSAFTVVSLEPPIVLVCIDRDIEMLRLIETANRFAVSILDRDQQVYADLFAGLGPRPSREFQGIPHHLLPSGSPGLDNASAWFDCAVDQIVESGDHAVVFGTVTAIVLGPERDDPLISYDGAYRRIESG